MKLFLSSKIWEFSKPPLFHSSWGSILSGGAEHSLNYTDDESKVRKSEKNVKEKWEKSEKCLFYKINEFSE